VVPGHSLCLVDDVALVNSGLGLADLAVLADAVSTPDQAIVRSGLRAEDTVVVVGVGGVGGFAVQLAAARGGRVIALDVSEERLAAIAPYGAQHCICTKGRDPMEVRKEIAAYVKQQGMSPLEWKIFECSGHPSGQLQAYALLTFGAFLSVVGYTLEKVTVRLSNLMAFDATAQGNWGCLPSLYPEALGLILSGKIALLPFIERRPLSAINDTMQELHHGLLRKRPVLIPDFD
jgi:6-hydroxycyclohex-1-ene-1-carbonyl-CoA dehydrogenase